MVGFPRGFAYIFVIVLLLELFVFAATWIMGAPHTRNDGFRYWIG